MKKIIVVGLCVLVAIVAAFYFYNKTPENKTLAKLSLDLEKTQFPVVCPGTEGNILWLGGQIDERNQTVSFDYLLKYEQKQNEELLREIRYNPQKFYGLFCKTEPIPEIIDNINALVMNYRSNDSDQVSLRITRDICRDYR